VYSFYSTDEHLLKEKGSSQEWVIKGAAQTAKATEFFINI
jgi:hypothetical protein